MLHECMLLFHLPSHPLSSGVALEVSTLVTSTSATSLLLLHCHLHLHRGLLYGQTIHYLSHIVDALQHVHLQGSDLFLLNGIGCG